MSKSYKHTPRSGDQKDKFFKNYSNRKLRRRKIKEDDISLNYSMHKKLYRYYSYNICDYESLFVSFEEYYTRCIKHWYEWRYRYEPFPSREKSLKEYYKWYIRK